jgi:predicted transcriptional regulator
MDRERNRGGDETITTIVTSNPRSYYHRQRFFNRDHVDMKRQMLNYLLHMGPTPITELIYTTAINHIQAKIYLNDLIVNGIIESKSLDEIIPQNQRIGGGMSGRSRAVKGRLNRLNENTGNLFILTKKGKKYVETLNAMEVLLKWVK